MKPAATSVAGLLAVVLLVGVPPADHSHALARPLRVQATAPPVVDQPTPDVEKLRDDEKEAAREREREAQKALIIERESGERDERANEARQRHQERQERLQELIDR